MCEWDNQSILGRKVHIVGWLQIIVETRKMYEMVQCEEFEISSVNINPDKLR